MKTVSLKSSILAMKLRFTFMGRWIDTMNAHGTLKTHVLQFSKFWILQNWTFFVPLPTRSSTDHLSSPSQQSLTCPILIMLQGWLMPQVAKTRITSFPSTIRLHLIQSCLNQYFPQLWIGHTTVEEQKEPQWPQSLPHLMPCDVF